MPNNRTPHEDFAAQLSKRRGVVAAGISDPEKKRAFIAAQGAGKMSDSELETELVNTRNKQAVGDYTSNHWSSSNLKKLDRR